MKEWTAADILKDFDKLDLGEADRLADKLGEILAGHHPGLQGCALAFTLALWLMGHEDANVREKLLEQHMKTVRALMKAG
jgi:hypothetical protein